MEKHKYQIRTNAKLFGDRFGVYIIDEPERAYYYKDKGKEFIENGRIYKFSHIKEAETVQRSRGWRKYPQKWVYTFPSEGRFVKQESYNHGTFEASEQEAKELLKKLQTNARNGWVRLYKMD